MKLRTQLIILSLLTLSLPWAGCEYIREMENTLRESQAQALANTVRTIAQIAALENKAYFEQHESRLSNKPEQNIYAFPLANEIVLDGYADDWGPLAEDLRYFDNQITSNSESSIQVGVIAATYKNYLYLFLQVSDKNILYRHPSESTFNNDQLRLFMGNSPEQTASYIIQTSAPGKVYAEYFLHKNNTEPVLARKNAIHGQWQDTSEGYNIEIRIPLKLATDHINFSIIDYADARQSSASGWYGTQDTSSPDTPGHLIQPAERILDLLTKFKQDNLRLRITDAQGWLLAATDIQPAELTSVRDLKLDETLQAILYQFYSLIMYWSESVNDSIYLKHGRLYGEAVEKALHNQATSAWYKAKTANHAIVSASYPVWLDGKVVGVVNAEQTSDAILSITNHALNRLIILSTVAIFISAVVLLGFATLLSFRIKRLRNITENFISSDGQIAIHFKPSSARDELGDLSRSFAQMHNRLNEYTQYLQTLASKLSHELRTPLAVIQSSLDNLIHTKLPQDASTYVHRAREGSERLARIITAMSEATRVEQALQASEAIQFDLCTMLHDSIEAYRDAYASHQFIFHQDQGHHWVTGSPELILQMLDKLIDNAVDFSPTNSQIDISINRSPHQIRIMVSNEGPGLPEHMQTRLFDSMVSLRTHKTPRTHLGLGLYIVKLIAQAHGGKVHAENRSDNKGVNFIVTLPAAQ